MYKVTRWNGTVVERFEDMNDLEKVMYKQDELNMLMNEVRDVLTSVRDLLLCQCYPLQKVTVEEEEK